MQNFSEPIFQFLNSQLFQVLLIAFTGVLAASPVLIVTRKIFGSGIKRSLRIAVVGATRAGKTSMITVLFDHIMSGKLAKFASVSGTETIERITQYQRLISSGLNLGPSTDNDVFAYRYFTSRTLLGIIPEKCDVEIADFPGEYSEELAGNIEKWSSSAALYRKEFFSWVVRADRYIFVIDVSPLVEEKPVATIDNRTPSGYARDMEVLFKGAVLQLKQELLDENLYSRSALIVFSKSDLLFLSEEALATVYGDPPSPLKLNDPRILASELEKIDRDTAIKHFSAVEAKFSDLLEFFKNNFSKTEVVFHSSYCDEGPLEKANAQIVRFSTPFEVN